MQTNTVIPDQDKTRISLKMLYNKIYRYFLNCKEHTIL